MIDEHQHLMKIISIQHRLPDMTKGTHLIQSQ